MQWGLTLITPPAAEPLTLAQAKQWLRVDDDDASQNDVLTDLIAEARDYCELYTGRALLTQTWKLTLDQFYGQTLPLRPGVQIANGIYGLSNWAWQAWQERGSPWVGFEGQTIRLPFPPLQQVASVQYLDATGVQQTLDPSQYLVDATREPGRLMPAYQAVWPATRAQMNAVAVTYVAGFASAALVPRACLRAMKTYLAGAYEYREQLPDEVLDAVNRLLEQAWTGEYQ